MNAAQLIGIDVGKKKLDVVLPVNGKRWSKVLDNSASGRKQLLDWLTNSKIPLADLHVCMGATGACFDDAFPVDARTIGTKPAVVLAVMHKLTDLAIGVIRIENPFDANYFSEMLV
jgi:hypothetical protein